MNYRTIFIDGHACNRPYLVSQFLPHHSVFPSSFRPFSLHRSSRVRDRPSRLVPHSRFSPRHSLGFYGPRTGRRENDVSYVRISEIGPVFSYIAIRRRSTRVYGTRRLFLPEPLNHWYLSISSSPSHFQYAIGFIEIFHRRSSLLHPLIFTFYSIIGMQKKQYKSVATCPRRKQPVKSQTSHATCRSYPWYPWYMVYRAVTIIIAKTIPFPSTVA